MSLMRRGMLADREARYRGDHLALVCGSERLTWRHLGTRGSRLANALGPGHRPRRRAPPRPARPRLDAGPDTALLERARRLTAARPARGPLLPTRDEVPLASVPGGSTCPVDRLGRQAPF